MNRAHAGFAFLGAILGTLLQTAGLVRIGFGALTEVDLPAGVLTLCGGTILLMGSLESLSLCKGRAGSWALMSVFCVIGLGVVVLLPPLPLRSSSAPPVRAKARSPASRRSGLALLAILGAGAVASSSLWWHRNAPASPLPADQLRRHEALAFERLCLIGVAQQRYRERDWDGDGTKTYSPFLVHLWRSVDPKGNPVAVDLLPRSLAMAMDNAWALNGYYFVDLRWREREPSSDTADEEPDREPIDEVHDWAVAAIPDEYARSGRLSFVVDSSCRVFARDVPDPMAMVPLDPLRQGFSEIKSLRDLQRLQDHLEDAPAQGGG